MAKRKRKAKVKQKKERYGGISLKALRRRLAPIVDAAIAEVRNEDISQGHLLCFAGEVQKVIDLCPTTYSYTQSQPNQGDDAR